METAKRVRVLRDVRRILSAAAIILVAVGVWLWSYVGEVPAQSYLLWIIALIVIAISSGVRMGMVRERTRIERGREQNRRKYLTMTDKLDQKRKGGGRC